MKALNLPYGRAVLVLLTCIAGSIAILEGASGNAFPVSQIDKQLITSSVPPLGEYDRRLY